MSQFVAMGIDHHQIIDASPNGIWLLDLDGRVVETNRCASNFMVSGADPAWAQLWPADSRKAAERAVRLAIDGERNLFRSFLSLPRQVRVYLETSVSPLHDTAGDVKALIAVARNVTEEVEDTAFLRRIVELLPLSLTVRDAQNDQYILFNKAAEDIYGVNAEEALGKTPAELFSLGKAKMILHADAKALESAEGRKQINTKVKTATGVRHFSARRAVTFDDTGPRHVMCVSEDVTEQHARAEALRQALRAAEQASQAKSAFLANMSHEVRTPLNGIIAAADMLAAHELPERHRALTDLIRASGDHLLGLLSDVMDVARIESGVLALDPSPFNLADLVRDVAELFHSQATSRGLAFNMAIAPEAEGTVLGDRLRIRQIISNLLNNALKFTRAGFVYVGLERLSDGGLRLTVADSGVGFDPAQKAKLFDRFHQADNSHTRQFGGTGLGLTICLELCQLMGGTLDCMGAPDQGATFWIDLNLPSVEPTTTSFSAKADAPADLCILVAEDNAANRKVLELMLGDVVDLHMVENGALAVAEVKGRPFDLILMDMQMPEMDGLEATRAIRAIEQESGRETVPIIMLTANTLPEHVAASLAAGADLHLPKPVTPATLFGAVDHVLNARAQSPMRAAG